MKAYGIFQETVKDEATFAEYRKQVMPTLAAHGGRFLVRAAHCRLSKASGRTRGW